MHLKYRPAKKSEVLGQDHIINTINLDRPILLLGYSGVGKTTIAYILAKEFCNEENIIEINCIKDSKKSDIENILDLFMKSSIFGKEKVLILDELHGLGQSSKAQQDLLKPLESLPDYKKVIACATETGNLKPQLLDRFTIFKLKLLSKKELQKLLNYVCEQENIKLPRWLKILLIEKSGGVARKLLTTLPLVQNITDEHEAEFLLDISSLNTDTDVFELFKYIISGQIEWLQIVTTLKELLKTKSAESIRMSMIYIITGRLTSKYLKDYNEGMKLNKSLGILGNYFIPQESFLYMALFDMFLSFRGNI